MNQTQDNILRLATAVRHDRKLLAQVCATAKALKLPNPKRQLKQPSAQAQRLQNFVGVSKLDLLTLGGRFGFERVGNLLGAQAIYEAAQRKFAAMAVKREGK